MHVCMHIQKINFSSDITIPYKIYKLTTAGCRYKKIHISLRSALRNTHRTVMLFYRVMFTTGIGGIKRQ